MKFMSVQDDTHHFSHDASSHMFRRHFFDETPERFLDIDHQHHANKPNDANLRAGRKKKCR